MLESADADGGWEKSIVGPAGASFEGCSTPSLPLNFALVTELVGQVFIRPSFEKSLNGTFFETGASPIIPSSGMIGAVVLPLTII